MLQRLRNFWANPYAAPLTEAVGGVIGCARAPINNFIKGCRYAFNDDNYKYDDEKSGKYARLMARAERYDGGYAMIAVGGTIVGGLAFGGAGVAAGISLLGGALGQSVAATVLGLAFCGVGAVAGPFLAAGLVAAVGAMVGLGIGLVPGFFKGCKTALQHHRDKKTLGAVVTALPPAQAQDAELAKNLAGVMQHFNSLPKAHRAPFVRMLNEKYAQAAPGAQSDKALAVIDAMPEKDREIFIRSLRERLKDDFAAVAQKDAEDSTILQAPVITDGTIKLKKQGRSHA